MNKDERSELIARFKALIARSLEIEVILTEMKEVLYSLQKWSEEENGRAE